MPKTPYLYQNPFAMNWKKKIQINLKLSTKLKKVQRTIIFFLHQKIYFTRSYMSSFSKKILQHLMIQI